MIIYNKAKQIRINKDIYTKTVKAIRPQLTEKNKNFLKLLKLKVKK